jgi:hypothetical protein
LKHSRKKFWLSWLRLFTCFLWLRVKCDCPSLAQLCTLVTKDRDGNKALRKLLWIEWTLILCVCCK